jgi:RNA polymerase sigma-70 factor (ECF subfamily)
VPLRENLPARVTGVLAVLYLVFNEGYLSSNPAAPAVRAELTAEAIRLARLVHALLSTGGGTAGLLALILLAEARRAARAGRRSFPVRAFPPVTPRYNWA